VRCGQYRLAVFGLPTAGGRKRNRSACWSLIQQNLAPTIEMVSITGIHNDRLAQQAIANYSIHINLHKECTTENAMIPFEGFRASQLLSAGAIVISQHAAKQDELPYHGMVHFVSPGRIAETFKRITSLKQEARREMGDKARALYRKKFNASVTFQESGINTMLKQWFFPDVETRVHGTSDESARARTRAQRRAHAHQLMTPLDTRHTQQCPKGPKHRCGRCPI